MNRQSEGVFVYVGTYTQTESFARGKAEGIYVYRMDPLTGALIYVSKIVGVFNPSYLVIAPERRRLYAVNEHYGDVRPDGAVSAFAIDPVTKELTFLNQQSTHGLAPCYVSINRTGHYLLVANYMSGNVAVLPIEADGRLAEASDLVQHAGSGPLHGQEGPHAHCVVPDPASDYVVAADKGADKLFIYRLDTNKGRLLPADPPSVQAEPGAGPRHFVFHPHGRMAYAINELGCTITAYAYDRQCGALQAVQSVPTLPAGSEGRNWTADIHVAPSGQFVYGSNRGHDSIVIYRVDEQTGKLSYVGHEPTQGRTPRNFVIDPSGRFLLAANQNTDTIVTFRIDAQSGKLLATGHVTEAPTPVCLKML